ncbi:MAG: AAA family ATPase [Pirellulaceae bacterium]|nr:AAA family ATPase [Pirellulaceae bacterium]
MYLKQVVIENAGPIQHLSFDLPFNGVLPKPLILVGPNGSGKSTLLSFIVNALIGFKQQGYEHAEVELHKVYRVRSAQFIRNGACWYHAKLQFEGGLSLDEWTLNRPRKEFEVQVSPLPVDESWKNIPEDQFNHFALTPQPAHPIQRTLSRPIQKMFEQNVVLFFPSDRFELPDWLNEQSLAQDLHFPEPTKFEGQTPRKIFSRALLKPTLEWIKAVALDKLLHEHNYPKPVTFVPGVGFVTAPMSEPVSKDGRIIDFVSKVLARILGADNDAVQFRLSHRNLGIISIDYVRSGKPETIPSLLGLSAGQAALFCAFTNVIRDFDLAGAPFDDISDIRGIVIFDEGDLHLHVDLQYRVLPELIKLFPKVQFILTAHSPLLVMGMRSVFGDDGFHVREMPSGKQIETEEFSEFNHALAAFSQTSAYDRQVLQRIQQATRPVVITEGKTDVTHLEVAWRKLYGEQPLPFDVLSCGEFGPPSADRGGAKMLRTMLHACCLHVERNVIGLFDHDTEGSEQFNSLKKDDFGDGADLTHLKHTRQPVQALLLPVPTERRNFVSTAISSCFLAMEHYYSDSVLDQFGMKGDPVVADSAVFRITKNRKTAFAETVKNLNVVEFVNFKMLFERLINLLGVSVQSETPLPTETCNSMDTNITISPTFEFGETAIEIGASAVELPDHSQLATTSFTISSIDSEANNCSERDNGNTLKDDGLSS